VAPRSMPPADRRVKPVAGRGRRRVHSPYRILDDGGAAFAMGAIGGSVFHAYKGMKNSPRVRPVVHHCNGPSPTQLLMRVDARPLVSVLQGERLYGALQMVKLRAPLTGGTAARCLLAAPWLWFGAGAHRGPCAFSHASPLSDAGAAAGSFAVWGLVFSSFDCSLGYIRQRDDPWNAIGSGFLTGGVLAARAGLRASVQSAMVGGVLLALIEGLALTINKFTAEQYRPVRPELPAVATAPPSSTSLPPMKLPSLGGSAGGGAPLRKKESEFLPGTCARPSSRLWPRGCSCG